MHGAVLDRPACRHQRLGGDLAAEDALALLVGLNATEDVDLDRLEIEEVDEEVQRFAHDPMFALLDPARSRPVIALGLGLH